jgi:hypothetical protein
MKKQPVSTPKKYARTHDELSAAMGISREEICKKWIKIATFPCKTTRGWPVEAVMAWYRDQLRSVAAGRGGAGTPLAEARRDLVLKQIEKLDLELADLRREVDEAKAAAVKSALAQVARRTIDGWDIAIRNIGALTNDGRVVDQVEDEKLAFLARMRDMEVVVE